MAASSPYSPQTQTVLRRSKYLEDALTEMRQSSEIKGGWGDLAARLGATAILTHGKKKVDGQLAAALAQEAKDRAARITAPFDAQAVIAQPVGGAPPPPSQGPIQAASLLGGPPAPQAPPQAAPKPAGSSLIEALMPGLIRRESGGRPRPGPMTPYGQAQGQTQMLDATAESMAKKLGVPWRPDLMRAATPEAMKYQETLGAAYLQEGLDTTGNARDALRYYHGGPDRKLWGPKTNAYADAILADSPSAQMVGGPAPQGQMQVAPTMAQAQPPQGVMGFPAVPEGAPQQPQAPQGMPPQGMPQGQQWGPSPGEIALVRRLAADPRTQDQAEALAFELQKKYAARPKSDTVMINGVPYAGSPDAPGAGLTPYAGGIPEAARTQTGDASQFGLVAPPGTQVNRDPTGAARVVIAPQAGQQVTSAPGQSYQEAPITGGTGDIRGNPQARFEALKGLRAEIKPVIDSAIALRRNYSALDAGYRQQSGPGDLAMINGLQKMIDEGVVREGDVAMQLKAQGLEGGIAGVAAYMSSTGTFSPAIRDRIKATADDIYQTINGTYRQRAEGYRGIVDRTFGDGSFSDVLPPETVDALGWGAPVAPQGGQQPRGGVTAPKAPPGRADIEAEMRRRRLIP
jgi:hypothetical protein